MSLKYTRSEGYGLVVGKERDANELVWAYWFLPVGESVARFVQGIIRDASASPPALPSPHPADT